MFNKPFKYILLYRYITKQTNNKMAEINSCVVLCIEERNDTDYNRVETRLFITYDFE